MRDVLDEITIFDPNYDAEVTLYQWGLRVTLWSSGRYEMLYTERVSFFEYPDVAQTVQICGGLLYGECRCLVDGLLADGAAGQAVLA